MKTRRQLNESAFKKVRRKQAQIRGAQPERDRKYRQYIASFPCVVCYGLTEFEKVLRGGCIDGWRWFRQRSNNECAHIGDTGRGMRQKCSDYETVPLCGIEHHREGPQSIHKIGRKAFEALHGVDLLQISADLRKRFLEDQG